MCANCDRPKTVQKPPIPMPTHASNVGTVTGAKSSQSVGEKLRGKIMGVSRGKK